MDGVGWCLVDVQNEEDHSGMMNKKSDVSDAGPLIVGLCCVLRQLDTSTTTTTQFLRLCCAFVQGGLSVAVRSARPGKQSPTLSTNATLMMCLVSLIVHFSRLSHKVDHWQLLEDFFLFRLGRRGCRLSPRDSSSISSLIRFVWLCRGD